MDRDVTDEVSLTVSERDVAGLEERLAHWLGERLGGGVAPRIEGLRRPEGGGLSSVSVLFEATWPGGRRPALDLVARMPQEETSFPVFPSYDFRLQYDVMAAVRAHSDVPVPELVGLDEVGEVTGEPMILMRRVPGLVPTDNPPYVFGGWLHDAHRIFADGRVEQLGWPRLEIDYRSKTRHPERARLHLTTPAGEPLLVEVETLTSVALHLGSGYGGDPDWAHGQWRGRDWLSAVHHDLTDPDVQARVPWGAVDHAARATCEGRTGWGLFEHASMGRHDPTGFADWAAVAP
jgi:hypothetical protein